MKNKKEAGNMVEILNMKKIRTKLAYYEFAGLSTDEKQTTNVATGSTFLEVDTGDVYMFDGENSIWHKVGGSSASTESTGE